MAACVAHPLADVFWNMRPAVQRNHPRVVGHLIYQNHPPGTLSDLIIGAVIGGRHGRAGVVRQQAALLQAAIFGAVKLVASGRCRAIRLPLPGLRRQRRNLPIRRIGDQRSAQVGNHAAALAPKLVISATYVGRTATIAPVAVHVVNRFLLDTRWLPRRSASPSRRTRRDAPAGSSSPSTRLPGDRADRRRCAAEPTASRLVLTSLRPPSRGQ